MLPSTNPKSLTSRANWKRCVVAATPLHTSELTRIVCQARSELHAKRREEKELRSVEQEHVQQISTLEGEVAKLNKSLERSREAYETMKRNYTATCDEAERLRGLVADLRRVNRGQLLVHQDRC